MTLQSSNLMFQDLATGILTNVQAIYYTVPSGYRVLFKTYNFVNGTGGGLTVTLNVVRGGVQAAVIPQASAIAANGQVKGSADLTLKAGDTIQSFASAAASIGFMFDGIIQKVKEV